MSVRSGNGEAPRQTLGFPCLPLLDRAGAVASRFRVALYDCLYHALAEREACELVTANTRFLNNLRPHFPFLVDLASLP